MKKLIFCLFLYLGFNFFCAPIAYAEEHWECLGVYSCGDQRLKVYGGWLVKEYYVDGIGLVFVPDKDHQWKL